MIKVTTTLNPETSRFEAKDETGFVYYTAAKLQDLKTTIKRSTKYRLEIVEKFEKVVEVETVIHESTTPSITNPLKKILKTDKVKPIEKQQDWILANCQGEDLHALSKMVPKFCKHFNLTVTKNGRNMTWENALIALSNKGLIIHNDEKKGKHFYKFCERLEK